MDLAAEAGLNENYISDLELGRKEICLLAIAKIAKAFELTIADLMNGID